MNRRVIIPFVLMTLVLLLISACNMGPADPEERPEGLVRLIGPDGNVVWRFTGDTLAGLLKKSDLPSNMTDPFCHVYSTINNWPTPKFYVAEGYRLDSILTAAGLYDEAQTVTFRAGDDYEACLTKEQLKAGQFCYPFAGESDQGAEEVYPVIAYRWCEGTDDLSQIRDNTPTLLIGQRNPFEQSNPAYVVRVYDIIVSYEPCEIWPPASVFPAAGPIAAGETVKLQHPSFGKVKLYYTLDGSEPTMLSPMYNPSTYQLELNKPIPITEPTVIKVKAVGYGKLDSETVEFEFVPL